MTAAERHDLLVIGGGPSGAATGYWAARHGLDVAVVEKATFPREKTCGDGLTPRAVTQLRAMGLGDRLAGCHQVDGLRIIAHHRTLELAWPRHSVHPDHGYVIRRRELDTFVAEHAAAAGAVLHQGTEATAPELEQGHLVGATVKDTATGATRSIRAPWIVVADGSNSRFGRALGTARDRTYPQGVAIRGYFESPNHDDRWIESALDVRDRNGSAMPGYGWVFPVGDGTVNVGLGLLSTFRDWKQINTTALWHEFTHTLPDHWEIDPDAPLDPPSGGRLPMAGSVGPKQGPNWLLVGDAGGTINPFNGEGIDSAYETGRTAASLIAEAHGTGNGLVLARYPQLLDDEFRRYYRVARLFAEVIGNPRLMRELTRIGMRSRPLMEWALKVMSNMLDDDDPAFTERSYAAIESAVRLLPDRVVSR